jgi:hypothetical protein
MRFQSLPKFFYHDRVQSEARGLSVPPVDGKKVLAFCKTGVQVVSGYAAP